MQYNTILKFAFLPAILYLLLSILSVALTVHYWILGDWFITRLVLLPNVDRDGNTGMGKRILWYKDTETNVTIASGCMSLAASVIALVGWCTLRRPGMDTQLAAGKRRFWVLAVIVMTVTCASLALASLVMHYTEIGSDPYGCSPEDLLLCTREMAACNIQREWALLAGTVQNANVACTETVVVKWLQLVLAIIAIILCAMFFVQSRIRRKIRDARTLEHVSKEAH